MQTPHRRLFIGYLLSILLVFVYLNMFPAVRYIVQNWGETPVLVLPILITLVVLAGIVLLFLNAGRLNHGRRNMAAVVTGVIICLATLAVPDPIAPVKRIHVVEYMILSLLVRYTMSVRIQGIPLLLFSIFFSSLLGVHDELLQGLHPLRTYGIRDILVNTLGSIGGGLIWHGFGLFQESTDPANQTAEVPRSLIFYNGLLICSVCILCIPLYYFREQTLPLWPAVPLTISIFLFITIIRAINSSVSHGIRAVSYASFTLIVYILAARFLNITFF